MLGLGMYRELGPVLTALLFIGRAGSSIAAELGLMRATDQITALGLMAIDPIGKAVAPRFWAAVISMPLLTAFFCSLAITAGYFEAVHVIGIDQGFFWQVLKDSVDFNDDFLMAFVKSGVFPRRADHRRHVGGDHAGGGERVAAGADVQLRDVGFVVPLIRGAGHGPPFASVRWASTHPTNR
jgi:ABC-type transporter Mla maintaining outer membrane lipid asymmetry permease subunit MlaE